MIKEIIRKKTHCYFISPHLDDAIFSAGGLMSQLSGHVPMTVINVFTSPGDGHSTLSANAYLSQIGFNDPLTLFNHRIREDRLALNSIQSEQINLNEIDALWRPIPEMNLVRRQIAKVLPELGKMYPVYRLNVISGNIRKEDHGLISRLRNSIKEIIGNGNALIFCPIGFGNHVDHLIVRDVCLDLFGPQQLLFWADFPYVVRGVSRPKIFSQTSLQSFEIKHNGRDKIRLCGLYKTQFSKVIANPKMLQLPEKFYQMNTTNDIPMMKVERGLFAHLKALKNSPKSYLFNFVYSRGGRIRIHPYSESAQQVVDIVKTQIKTVLPEAEFHLIGSTGLKVAGTGDIDLLVATNKTSMQSQMKLISSIYGMPNKIGKSMVQWKLNINNYSVDLDLIDKLSNRFIEQTYLFKILSNNKSARIAYEGFKHSVDGFSNLDYSVARINFFHELIKRFKNTNSHPAHIGKYKFVKDLDIGKYVDNYKFAIYKSNDGENVFVKFLNHRKHLALKWLRNEKAVYRLLSTSENDGNVFSPKLISPDNKEKDEYLMIQYIKGKNIKDLNPKEKLIVFEKVMNYLSRYEKFKYSGIASRGPLYWLCILPIVVVAAIIKSPLQTGLIARTAIFIILNSITIIKRKKRSLVHRDFNDHSILTSDNRLYVLDFQLSCFADPVIDYAILLLKYYDKKPFIREIFKSKKLKLMLNGAYAPLYVYLAIFCIYDLSLSGSSHHLSSLCLSETIKMKLNT